jgi:ribosomal protein S18 acetylase RimI-like enzyme
LKASIRRGPDALPFNIRPVGRGDSQFLFELFRSVREFEFSILPEGQRDPLLRMQFELQVRDYADRYPHAEDFILLFDGEPAGRLLWSEHESELRILDIAVVRSLRNLGLATYAMNLAVERAAERNKAMRLSVRRDNDSAVRLYRQLGFDTIAADPLYLEMEHRR